jgi:cbb3-type cytochrome oxidase subunit 3
MASQHATLRTTLHANYAHIALLVVLLLVLVGGVLLYLRPRLRGGG